MATAVTFNPANGRVVLIFEKVDPEKFKDRDDVLIDPDLSAVRGMPPHEWIVAGTAMRRATEPERQALAIAAEAAEEIASKDFDALDPRDVLQAMIDVMGIDRDAIARRIRERQAQKGGR